MNNLISEYITTRICHDIIGNIGAVANAVELLEDGDTDFMEDIKSILKTSSSVLTARMKFFRLAFGLSNAGVDDAKLVEDTIASYLTTVGGKNPPALHFDVKDIKFNKPAMLLTMMMADLMVKGGTIHVITQDNRLLTGVDENVRISQEKFEQTQNVINQKQNEFTAQDAPVLYLLEICKKHGLKIEYVTSPILCFAVEYENA